MDQFGPVQNLSQLVTIVTTRHISPTTGKESAIVCTHYKIRRTADGNRLHCSLVHDHMVATTRFYLLAVAFLLYPTMNAVR